MTWKCPVLIRVTKIITTRARMTATCDKYEIPKQLKTFSHNGMSKFEYR